MPDHAPLSVVAALEDKSGKLPVPIDDICFRQKTGVSDRPVTLVWNHRWEYDKGPDRLYLVLKELVRRGLDFRIHLLGQRFRKWPEAFDRMKGEFKMQILSWGYIENRHDYLQLLQQSEIVFSTALHDFQGLAMLEAMASGCIPVAPNRLAYPEYIPASLLSDSCAEDAEQDANAIATMILNVAERLEFYRNSIPELGHLTWSEMVDQYSDEINSLTTP